VWTFRLAMTVVALAFPASAMAQPIAITVKNMQFAPATVAVRVGDTVTWTNQDFVGHTTTARSGEWDIKLAPGKSGSVVMKKSGSFAYYCRFHPNMTGTVTVQ
jgi:plastocyanin